MQGRKTWEAFVLPMSSHEGGQVCRRTKSKLDMMYISHHATLASSPRPVSVFRSKPACEIRSYLQSPAQREKKCTIRNVFAFSFSFLFLFGLHVLTRFISILKRAPSTASSAFISLYKKRNTIMYHFLWRNGKWWVFISPNYCTFWSLMLLKVFLNFFAFYVVHILLKWYYRANKAAFFIYIYIFSRSTVWGCSFHSSHSTVVCPFKNKSSAFFS